ncbi:MAG: hypothetical protein IJC15_02135, partial [Clostridia bacterium]|nr:hypothetical protein [Clostridia bacterium]
MKPTNSLPKQVLRTLLAFVFILSSLTLSAFAAEGEDPVASLTVGETVTEYGSFADAIAAANNINGNCTLRLLRDTAETDGGTDSLFYIGKNGVLTVDFGAHTLTCDEFTSGTGSSMKLTGTTGGVNGKITFYGPGCSIDSGVYRGTVGTWLMGEVEINGGTFAGTDSKMLVADGSDIDINGGTFTGADGIRSTDDGRIYIYGGTFTLTDDSKTLLSADDDGYISVSGGTFTAATDVSADSTADVVLQGGTFIGGIKTRVTTLADILRATVNNLNYQYMLNGEPQSLTSGQMELTGGDVTVQNVIAKVNSKYCASLSEAATAFAAGGTFTLLADCMEWQSEGRHWITLTGGGTFDLNGHTLTAKGGSSVLHITAGNTPLTIKDSSSGGTGKITGASYSIWHDGDGDVSIESGIYQNFIRNQNGSLIINGGTFENNAFGNVQDDEAKVVVNGGTFLRGLWFTAGNNQNVFEILGQGKTYQTGDEIWSRARVQALGDVYEFQKDSCVTIAKESDAIASFTYCETNSDTTPDVYLFTSLSAAIAKANSVANADANDYITLHKDSSEDITVSRDICMVFEGKASG